VGQEPVDEVIARQLEAPGQVSIRLVSPPPFARTVPELVLPLGAGQR
jgi:hypothetical protein